MIGIVDRPLGLRRYLPRRVRRKLRELRAAVDGRKFSDLIYANYADFTAHANSTSETSLIDRASADEQPTFPAGYFLEHRRTFWVRASGVVSNTGTPTITFQVRVGSVVGPTDLTGTSVGVSAAITTQSGVSNKKWDLELFGTVNAPGQGSNACTLNCHGNVFGRGWMGASGVDLQPLEPTTPDTATWTATINGAVQNYLNLSATWSAASASNTITCKSLVVVALF